MLGWWPSRAVTFIDNHDTGSTQAHWPFPAQFLHQVSSRHCPQSLSDLAGHQSMVTIIMESRLPDRPSYSRLQVLLSAQLVLCNGVEKIRWRTGLCVHLDTSRHPLPLPGPPVDRWHAEAQPLATPAIPAAGAWSPVAHAFSQQAHFSILQMSLTSLCMLHLSQPLAETCC